MEFSGVDTYQITLDGTIQAIDPSKRGGCSVVVKNLEASGGTTCYIGPAANEAGAALSSTTGFPLAPQESIALDLSLARQSAGKEFSVIGTNGDLVAVLVLRP